MKEKITPWDIFEVLNTENRIQLYVDAAVEESKTDTDPSFLADALATAAEARRRLDASHNEKNTVIKSALPEIMFDENTAIGEVDKTARTFGYHVTLAAVK